MMSTGYAHGLNSNLIRNYATRLPEHIEKLHEQLSRIQQSAIMEKYNLTDYDGCIIGVVCTPHTIYTPIGKATEEAAPGLRIASSLAELAVWLNKEGSTR